MAIYNEVKRNKTFMGKLKFGGDVLEELTSICDQNDIRLGRVEALGAVQKARVGFYDQQARKYDFIEIDKPLEITKIIGNISVRDGKPMIHAHITLSDSQGNAFGGHLAPGTIVFACEFIMNSYDGPDHIRDYDEQTGLPLWKL
ncbi:MAG: PPC domain-containing DNA-binding protein [Planctomycetota bacterium]|jgi:predicted DNA-binding protein with PD1-like motif